MTGARELGCWAAARTCARAASMAWGLLLVPACFHPSYDRPACGPNGECPSGWTCNAQLICENDSSAIDASLPDVSTTIDGGPGTGCYGPAGWRVCFNPVPNGSINLPSTLNTDGGAPCFGVQAMGWAAPQPAACFIVSDTITVPGGGTAASGSRPLVLVANRLITIAGVLDVASNRGDTGTTPSECQPFAATPGDPGGGIFGGGGGAGGSFMTRAGNGGAGDGGIQNGQAASAEAVAPTHLRGGCPGQAGGALSSAYPGIPGAGGGSVYLVSGGEIAIQRAINASGAGGGGGDKRAGGSGGGSGGMIVLYAATITVSAPPAAAPVLMANGGGGGGGSQGLQALDGSDPSLTSPLAPAAGGGNGGQGYPAAAANDLDGTSGAAGTGEGGGGGGGAAGYIRSNKPLVGAVVSPAADIVP